MTNESLPVALEPALRDLIRVMFCMSAIIEADTAPVAASSRSSGPNVARIFDERPVGQNTTSKPPPEGIMNVEVWSSNAVASQSHKEYTRSWILYIPKLYASGQTFLAISL